MSEEKPSRWRGATHWLKVAFGILILALVLRFAAEVDWPLLLERIRTADASWVGLTVLLLFTRLLSWHWRWSSILARTEDRTSAPRRFAILLASVMTNHVVPSMRLAGGLLRARFVARGALGFGQAYATVLFDTTFHHATSGVFTWVTMLAACWVIGYHWVAIGLLVAGGSVLTYVGLRVRRQDPLEGPIARYLKRLQEPGGRLGALVNRSQGLVRMAGFLLSQRTLWWRVPLLSIVWMTTSVAAQWALFRALDLRVGFWVAAAAIGLGVIATVLTQTPGGIGSTETAMVAAYAAFGIDQVDALAGTLLYRGLHYVLVLGIGIPALAWCEVSRPRPAPTEE